MLFRGVVRVRDDLGRVLGNPLMGAGGALDQLPLVLEQDLQEAVTPLGGLVGPGDLEAGGDRVRALAAAVGAEPAEAPSGSGPTCASASPAPWVLPKVWPPAISANVSSSFMAIRLNVSRMNAAASLGSGLPMGPSGLT